MKSNKIMSLGAAALMASTAFGGAAYAQQQFVTIGTGGVTGVYYAAGGAICRLMNQTRGEHGYRCSAESTGGSVYNLNAMRQGEFDFAMVQSDWQYHAMHGSSQFEDVGADEELRAVISIHSEPMTLLARADSGISELADIAGKRVNIGPPGSGTQGTVDMLMEAAGMSRSDLSLAAELRPDEQGPALCDNQIDAFFYAVGHPSANIADPTTTCGAQIIPIEGEGIEAMVQEHPYYALVDIPGGLYAGNDDAVPTFGVMATLVTHAGVSDEAVYNLTKSIFENMDTFRGLHPAFAHLEPENMVVDGISAPVHPGAQQYFDEQGWN
ncbi:MAG: TAXI family TRAP transporter solute-binding subunit [Paracoccus sp. (in: a-proteobacteria)]|nr:TAXI family TRAP transporter solute-binding subunit [Paracoccus sp. (in: a-proteobacteria)]